MTFFNHAAKSAIDWVVILQKALLNLINMEVGSEMTMNYFAVRVVSEIQTKQCKSNER